MKKLFCVIEQGKFHNDYITKMHHKWFNKDYCDWYRINWSTEKDNLAKYHEKNICYSEGRSILYDRIPKNYEYYIFIDDDLIFENFDGSIVSEPAEVIKNYLLEYNPISASFISYADWLSSLLNKRISRKEIFNKKVFHGPTHDLMFCIYSADLAKLVLPVIHHGSGGCLHYAMYIVAKLYPEKQHIYTGMASIGLRGYAQGNQVHGDRNLPQFNHVSELYKKFNEHTFDKDFILGWTDRVWDNSHNYFYADSVIISDKKTITVEDVAKIYDVNNKDYVNRSPRANGK